MILFFLLLTWISYSGLEGFREAHYWLYRTAYPEYEKIKDMDQHKFFSFQRFLVLALISSYVLLITKVYIAYLLIFIANALVFSFFHNGTMYLTRNELSKKLNPDNIIYPKGWFDQSTTSQAKLTFLMGPISRTIQFFLGIIIYISVFIVYL